MASIASRALSVRWWGVGFLTVLATGCMTVENNGSSSKPPAPGVPCQIVATWQNSIAYAADPTKGGKQAPGLAGRVYLFGQTIDFPMTGDGALTIDMFDESDDKSIQLEQWNLDAATMQRLLRHDLIGWGYTLFLPSGRWKPEMSRLRMRACYKLKTGAPLYSESVVTLVPGNGVIREGTKPVALVKPTVPGR